MPRAGSFSNENGAQRKGRRLYLSLVSNARVGRGRSGAGRLTSRGKFGSTQIHRGFHVTSCHRALRSPKSSERIYLSSHKLENKKALCIRSPRVRFHHRRTSFSVPLREPRPRRVLSSRGADSCTCLLQTRDAAGRAREDLEKFAIILRCFLVIIIHIYSYS